VKRLTDLTSNVAIGGILLKNRLGLGPINLGGASRSDFRADPVVDLYSHFASGGLALAYLGGVAISQSGRSNSSSMVMLELATQRLLGKLVEMAQASDMHIAVQLMHSGRQASSAEIGSRPLAPSGIPCPYYMEIPAVATIRDIKSVVNGFATAARTAAMAGCQIIEVHAAHGYLVSGFLSRATNHRVDQYGGSLSKRFRILDEIVMAIRESVNVTVGVRINVFERHPRGLRVSEVAEGLLGLRGNLDFVSISGGMYAIHDDVIIPRRSMGPAIWREQARELRRLLMAPIMLAGNIETATLADEIVSMQEADMVLMVRSLLADPDLLRKSLDTVGVIQPCTELYLCKYHSRGASHVYCPYNTVMRTRLLPTVDLANARRRSSER
jgi:2,4-dienoyl-CoA reductase-like NADH-dependent reductase (Old Yellow Enzyme family)